MKKKFSKHVEIIDKIEKIRSKNNSNWMDILRLAFKYSPQEASKIMVQINNKDKQISNWLSKLDEKKRKKNK